MEASTHDTRHTTHTRPQVQRLCVSVAAASSVHNAGAASATEAVAVGLHDARACSPSLFQTRAGPGGMTPANAKLGHYHHHHCN
jgi:hypothetical protein